MGDLEGIIMTKHSDYCTHMNNEEDRDVLTRKLFDVNMRLFETSEPYKRLVLDACAYIEWSAKTEKEGYKKPHGWSGANAGIPWNIIAYVENDKSYVMINPKIESFGTLFREVKSNCGSLTLDKPRTITRPTMASVSFYNTRGKHKQIVFGPTPGFTIQHEIQHNLGILITDLK